MEIIKDYIRASTIEAPLILHKTIEHECIVPDNMPDALSICAIDGMANIDNIRCENTFTVADISIDYNIIYMSDSDEKPIKAFPTKATHTLTADIDETHSGFSTCGMAVMQSTEYTLVNSRKISIKSNLRIELLVEDNTQTGLPVEIAGSEKIHTLENKANICTCTEEIKSMCDINSNIELPGIKKPFERLLNTSASFGDINYNVNGNELQIRANLCLNTLYIPEDNTNQLQIIENQIPFTHTINVELRDDQQIRIIRPVLRDCNVRIIEDSDGMRRILNVNAHTEFIVKTYTNIEFTMIEDAFCPQDNIGVSKEKIKMIESIKDVNSSFVIKEIIRAPEELPIIKEIANVNCCPGEFMTTGADEEITIQGEIICNIMYLTDDITAPIASFCTKLQYTETIEQRGLTDEDVICINPEINHTSSGMISDKEIELRLSVTVRGITGKFTFLDLVTDLICDDDSDENMAPDIAPILLYIVQPGDSIWKISKKYKTDPEYLKKINRLPEPYIIYPGQKLIISK